MRTASIQTELNLSKAKLWDLLTDISNYPKYILFVQKTELKSDKFILGAIWYDWTTILYVQMKVKHIVTSLKPHREICFDVPLIFGGIMQQKFSLSGDTNKTFIKGQIGFDFKNNLMDKILGRLLQKRLQVMLDGSLDNFKKIHDV